jgi:hypothetical protein
MSTDVISATPVPFEKPAAPVAPADTTASAVPPEPTIVDAAAIPEAPAPVEAPAAAESMEEILKPFHEELATTGEISGASIKALAEKLGASEDIVRYTCAGMKVERVARDAEILSAVGGDTSYKEIVTWASGALSPEEAQAFNSALVSGTKEQAMSAVMSLRQKFTAVNGSPRNEIAAATTRQTAVPAVAPQQPAVAAVKPYGSFSELVEAQRDKRYGTNAEYTTEVVNRLRISKF